VNDAASVAGHDPVLHLCVQVDDEPDHIRTVLGYAERADPAAVHAVVRGRHGLRAEQIDHDAVGVRERESFASDALYADRSRSDPPPVTLRPDSAGLGPVQPARSRCRNHRYILPSVDPPSFQHFRGGCVILDSEMDARRLDLEDRRVAVISYTPIHLLGAVTKRLLCRVAASE
jgi:hypothetical protein